VLTDLDHIEFAENPDPELLEWLSKSQQAVAQSRPGEQVPLPPAGWASV
jgi:uncharacterized protein YegL